jgi:thioredoxin 1
MKHTTEPTRGEVDALAGLTLLEFGTSWCPHCQAAQPYIAQVLKAHEGLRHVRVEDGPARPLGRSFGVKLWPTLILMENGVQKMQVVRPRSVAQIEALFAD